MKYDKANYYSEASGEPVYESHGQRSHSQLAVI